MRDLAIASYSITGSAYILFALWLLFQGRAHEASQRFFVAWLLVFAIVGTSGTILSATTTYDIASTLYRIHMCLLIALSATLWLFATSLHRDLTERDTLYFLPALAMMPLVWAAAVTQFKQTPFGWDIVSVNAWFILILVVTNAYYGAAVFQIYRVAAALRGGSDVAIRRVRIILLSVVLILLASLLNAAVRGLEFYWGQIILNVFYTLPAAFMAYSFRLTEA